MHNLACIFALAPESRPGPEGEEAPALAGRYRTAAVSALRDTLALVGPAERAVLAREGAADSASTRSAIPRSSQERYARKGARASLAGGRKKIREFCPLGRGFRFSWRVVACPRGQETIVHRILRLALYGPVFGGKKTATPVATCTRLKGEMMMTLTRLSRF